MRKGQGEFMGRGFTLHEALQLRKRFDQKDLTLAEFQSAYVRFCASRRMFVEKLKDPRGLSDWQLRDIARTLAPNRDTRNANQHSADTLFDIFLEWFENAEQPLAYELASQRWSSCRLGARTRPGTGKASEPQELFRRLLKLYTMPMRQIRRSARKARLRLLTRPGDGMHLTDRSLRKLRDLATTHPQDTIPAIASALTSIKSHRHKYDMIRLLVTAAESTPLVMQAVGDVLGWYLAYGCPADERRQLSRSLKPLIGSLPTALAAQIAGELEEKISCHVLLPKRASGEKEFADIHFALACLAPDRAVAVVNHHPSPALWQALLEAGVQNSASQLVLVAEDSRRGREDRLRAIGALGVANSPPSQNTLISLLSDPDKKIRRQAYENLSAKEIELMPGQQRAWYIVSIALNRNDPYVTNTKYHSPSTEYRQAVEKDGDAAVVPLLFALDTIFTSRQEDLVHMLTAHRRAVQNNNEMLSELERFGVTTRGVHPYPALPDRLVGVMAETGAITQALCMTTSSSVIPEILSVLAFTTGHRELCRSNATRPILESVVRSLHVITQQQHLASVKRALIPAAKTRPDTVIAIINSYLDKVEEGRRGIETETLRLVFREAVAAECLKIEERAARFQAGTNACATAELQKEARRLIVEMKVRADRHGLL